MRVSIKPRTKTVDGYDAGLELAGYFEPQSDTLRSAESKRSTSMTIDGYCELVDSPSINDEDLEAVDLVFAGMAGLSSLD